MRFLCALCVLCGLVLPSLALDREAFTFTNYDLNLRVEPEQHRLGVRGRITLRNDSATPQKSLALQISSTLNWRSVQLDGTTAQYVTHLFTSDIDHTGALSEAIVTLPREVPPQGTVELDVGYEGVILLDSTRLTRIGVPEDRAKHSDWDQISKAFTAVRGIGFVAWYPVATEAGNLSEGNSVPETVGRWKTKQADSKMVVRFESTLNAPILFSGTPDGARVGEKGADFSMTAPGGNVPTFVTVDYQTLTPNDLLTVRYLPGQEEAAKDYAEIAAQLDPALPVGGGSGNLQILGLPDPDASSFVTEGMLLTPLNSPMTNPAELDMVYAKARQLVRSPRAWIQEGLAHYAQAAFIEAQKGRQAALDYLDAREAILVESEKQAPEKPGNAYEAKHSLISAEDDLYLQTKSMDVWWMLKDMLGNLPIASLLNYNASADKEATYLQRVIEKNTHRDLQWFFDDWVYHDRGLPDFRVDSVFSRPVETGGFLVTITVENLGSAGAEVPVVMKTESDEIRRRLEVRAKSKASVRIETVSKPLAVTVNDGSVPESDSSDNTYKIEAPRK